MGQVLCHLLHAGSILTIAILTIAAHGTLTDAMAFRGKIRTHLMFASYNGPCFLAPSDGEGHRDMVRHRNGTDTEPATTKRQTTTIADTPQVRPGRVKELT